ncbi:MAG: ABC transporter ATP-binding protein [Propioniciclava sp.]|uniref:ABC transporter ATP-binding protein n=1 Tax=Propioniciclava sp. TaxID=2038686 RepID=UPI0039E569DB
MPAQSALIVDGLEVSLGGRPVLRGLTFTAEPAEVTALLGPNGAGKTTTIRVLTGLIPPGAGTVRVLGHAPGDPRALARLGLMPQSAGAWSGVRPLELLRYLASLYANPQPVEQVVEALALESFVRTPYRRLSGGQQQAVNLAGALIGRPEFVLLDEPTAGMDPHARRRTWSVIRAFADAGAGVLLTTHAMDEAAALADRVWITDAGRITISGTVAELTAEASLEDVFVAHTQDRS